MKLYIVNVGAYEGDVAGVYSSLERAMAAHPAAPGEWALSSEGVWTNGLDHAAYANIVEWELDALPQPYHHQTLG